MFVVDSADHDRIAECHDEIHRLCHDEDLKNSLLLVFANKQDLSSAMTIDEVKSHLKLESLDIPWRKLRIMPLVHVRLYLMLMHHWFY